MEDVLKGKSFKNHSFLQGWNPLPPFSEGPPPILGTLLFLKQIKNVTPPLSESHTNWCT